MERPAYAVRQTTVGDETQTIQTSETPEWADHDAARPMQHGVQLVGKQDH